MDGDADRDVFHMRNLTIILSLIAIHFIIAEPAFAQAFFSGGDLPSVIKQLYELGVRLIVIIAFLMIFAGGYFWMVGRAKQAKETIRRAIIGLTLALCSYVLLWAINPNLTEFNMPALAPLTPIGFELELPEHVPTEPSGMGEGTVSENALKDPICTRTGGPERLPELANALAGKIAYRFGGGGGPPPYSETRYTSYNNFCPAGNHCFDCGGYVNYLLKCAGMNAPGMGTANIFRNSERITSYDIAKRTINNVELKPGDLVGTGTVGGDIGHVILYLGDGVFTQTASNGGEPGRQPGANPSKLTFSENLMKKKWVKHVRRYRTVTGGSSALSQPKQRVALLSQPEGGEDSSEDAPPSSEQFASVCEFSNQNASQSVKLASASLLSRDVPFVKLAARQQVCRLVKDMVLPSTFDYPGIHCERAGKGLSIAKIAESFSGKVTYRLGGKGESGGSTNYAQEKLSENKRCPNGTLCLDCSAYVNTVLQCAGLPAAGSYTDMIYKHQNAEVIQAIDIDQWAINGRELEPGDLIVYPWKNIEPKEAGHVIIYVGGGQFSESASQSGEGKKLNQALKSSFFNQKLIDRIKKVERERGAKVKIVRMGGGLHTPEQIVQNMRDPRSEPRLTQ